MNTTPDQVDDLEIEGEDDDQFDVEIVDDVPPEEKPRTKAKAKDDPKPTAKEDDDDSDDTDEDDLEGYSEKVQKRLKKLTFKYREAERKEQDAARLREEAIKYAQQVAEENKRLRQSVEQGQGAYVEQAKARATAELERAKREFREAYESGEADKLTEAQTALAKAQNDLYRLENYRPQPVRSNVPERDWSGQQQPQQPTQPQQPQLTALQREWMERNPWFGQNKAMTGFAYGVHEELIQSGVDPDTRTYYDRIDQAMRQRFADQFGGTGDDDDDDDFVEVDPKPRRKPANVVAPAQRSAKQPRKIRLTATQASLARRLGLTPEQYAAQMLKEAKNG